MNWRPRNWVAKTIPTVVCALFVFATAQTMPACSAPATDTVGSKGGSQGGMDASLSASECDHPNPGCGCSKAGETAPCGKIFLKSGDFIQCEEGTTTCDGSKWGACDGDIIVEDKAISGGGFSLQSLGKPTTCGAVNPCDPYCYVQTDTAPGLDGGPGLTVLDGGLQVAIPPGLNTCNEATNGPSTESNLFTAPNAASFVHNATAPIACTGGGTATDSCPFDSRCSALTGGTCAPYGDGTTNVTTSTSACAAIPDYTLGLGCWQGSSLQGLQLQVCNRGGVNATSGNLVIDFTDSPPTAAGTSAGCGAGTFPNELPVAGATNGGYCTIPLTTVPIGPGECISFNMFNPSAPITCNSVSAGNPTLSAANFPLTATSQIAAVVNPPTGTAFTPAVTPLPECNACNNYTTFAANSYNKPYAACAPTWCGYQSGASGGAVCSTNIVGTVMDPGLNVGLSNVAVYVATSTPITLPDEPAIATPGTAPTCDSCASLSSPGYLQGVTTRVDGTFSLAVTPGTYTVVAQLGRWRRIVTNLAVPACSNTTIPNDSIRMPRTHAEGDIPHMAIVEGSQESLECWLAAVGVSTSEFAPYAAADTHRIHLYQSVNGGPGLNYWNGSTSNSPPAATQLWDSGSAATNTINDYSSVLIPCDGQQDNSGTNATATGKASVVSYNNAGGRTFINHWGGQTWVEYSSDANWSSSAVASWNNGAGTPNGKGTVIPGTAPVQADQAAMYAWLAKWDNTPNGAGFIQSAVPRGIATSTGADSVELVTFAGPVAASFWYNTPVTASAGSYCGRVVFNDMHVSSTRASNLVGGSNAGNSFPGTCVSAATQALTSEELALEYEMFQLSACNLGVSNPIPPPPPPPPPPPLMATTFTRTFQASCSPGFTVRWGFFEWEASIPAGTSISFAAQTAPNGTSGMPGTYGAVVPIGTANVSSTTMFATTAKSVDADLVTAGQTSQAWLEVEMTLNPTTMVSPVLTQWQQLYDCVP